MARSRLVTWIGRTVAVVALLLLVAVAAVWAGSSRQLSRVHDVPREFTARGGSATRGEHVVRAISACASCHGEDLGGSLLIDAPAFMRLPAPNLTAGQGGIGGALQASDWERAIRHGVGRDGRGLLIMPSDAYRTMTDADVADAVAYLQSLPPVDRALPERSIGPAGRAMLALGARSAVSTLRIDHAAVGGGRPAEDPVGRGEYLAMTCRGCHGESLAGLAQGVEPGTPPPPNLTSHPEAPTAAWGQADFVRALRTGRLPDGREMHPVMPWRAFAALSDQELADLWAYLRAVPPVPPVAPVAPRGA